MNSSNRSIVNINGQLLEPEQATISVFDRGFLYGDSIYEVTMSIEGVPFMIEQHLDRLERSARKIGLPLPKSRTQILQEFIRTTNAIQCPKCYVRVIFTRGAGEITLDPTREQNGNLVIIAKELANNPKTWYEKGVSVVIADILRNHQRAIDPSVKSGNYLNNILAMGEAKRAATFDAIMLNHDGNVAEATTSNIWLVERGVFITPPLSAGLLDGITRASLFKLTQFNMREENISPERLKAADEIFLTSTTKEIVPIVKVDANTIGSGKPGKHTRQLHQAYQAFIRQHLIHEKKRLKL